MKLIRSGSTIFATGVQASSSAAAGMIKGPSTGILLDIANSHVSGNTDYDIVTKPYDGANWSQQGQEIRVKVSSSTTSGQYASRLDMMHSWRFWDTGVKVSDNPGCIINLRTLNAMQPAALDVHEVYLACGFITAPPDSISNIQIGSGDGDGASTGTSWSSIRWFATKWQDDSTQSLNTTTRQGENTFSFGSDLKPKVTAPTDRRYNICFQALLCERLDGQWEWTESSTIVNYPHTDASGDQEFVQNLATDTPIGASGDLSNHHIYVFIAVGRGSVGDEGVQTFQAEYRVFVG